MRVRIAREMRPKSPFPQLTTISVNSLAWTDGQGRVMAESHDKQEVQTSSALHGFRGVLDTPARDDNNASGFCCSFHAVANTYSCWAVAVGVLGGKSDFTITPAGCSLGA